MRNVLITGCNGYLGVEMCMYFRMHGWHVYGVDPKPAPKCQEGVLEDFENKHIQDLIAPAVGRRCGDSSGRAVKNR